VVLEVEQSERTLAMRATPALQTAAAATVETVPAMAAIPAAAPRDPIAGAPHALWHVCMPSGDRYGPVAGDVLRQWIGQWRVTADTLIWREGWNDWQRADAVFTELAAAQPPPATAPPAPAQRADDLPYDRSGNNPGLMIALLIIAVFALAPLLGYVLYKQL
jgi:hypothetical protein